MKKIEPFHPQVKPLPSVSKLAMTLTRRAREMHILSLGVPALLRIADHHLSSGGNSFLEQLASLRNWLAEDEDYRAESLSADSDAEMHRRLRKWRFNRNPIWGTWPRILQLTIGERLLPGLLAIEKAVPSFCRNQYDHRIARFLIQVEAIRVDALDRPSLERMLLPCKTLLSPIIEELDQIARELIELIAQQGQRPK